MTDPSERERPSIDDPTEPVPSRDRLDRTGGAGGEPLGDGPAPTVLLLLPEGRNRQLLAELLAPDAAVVATTDVGALADDVDLCVVDPQTLGRHREAIVDRRDAVDPVFLPVVLVASGDQRVSTRAWSVVDDVVHTPVSRAALRTRLQNLLIRRRQSRALADREAELGLMLSELRVRDRAIAEAPVGITIADARDDNPLVYVNDAFLELTGYDRSEAIGRNCRFLQGEETDQATVEEMRRAIEAAEPVSVDVVNYTRDGERFWNKVDIAPVHGDDGEVSHYVGFQTDVTERTLQKQRIDVLNRLLRHNLRNELNVIGGYIAELAERTETDHDDVLEPVRASVDRLTELSEEVRHAERIFDSPRLADSVQSVSAVVEEIRTGVVERYPDVTVRTDVPDEQVFLSAGTLPLGCVDYLGMLLDGNDRDAREVSVVATYDRSDAAVDVALGDNGPGLTEDDWAVVRTGQETPLHHSDQLGLWVLRWVTTTVGGELHRPDGSNRLHVRCPVREPTGEDGETTRGSGETPDGRTAADGRSDRE
jgi:PAS domain S-box-containing protein